MDRGYPTEACGIPGILMPAACPTFIRFKFGFIGEPVKPPLDVIFQIHQGFEVTETEIRSK